MACYTIADPTHASNYIRILAMLPKAGDVAVTRRMADRLMMVKEEV